MRAWLVRVCPCCVPEELEPLRVSHKHGISSSDARPRRAERSAHDVATEAVRAQEWCVNHLNEVELTGHPEDDAGRADRLTGRMMIDRLHGVADPAAGQTDRAWAPPDKAAEVELDRAISESYMRFAAVASPELVGTARYASGLAPLLAIAQLAAERASVEAGALVASGCVRWLQDVLARSDALASAAATHRVCYALRNVLEHAPPPTYRQLRAELKTGALVRLLCSALYQHKDFAPVCKAACMVSP